MSARGQECPRHTDGLAAAYSLFRDAVVFPLAAAGIASPFVFLGRVMGYATMFYNVSVWPTRSESIAALPPHMTLPGSSVYPSLERKR
jgi:hypothetical protein